MVLSFVTCGFLSVYRDSCAPGVGQEGLATPIVLDMDYPLVALLLKEFTDMFSDPNYPPDMCVI